MLLLGIYVAFYLGGIVASLWASGEVAKFLSSHTEISSSSALDDFKVLARRNMYLALALIGVFVFGVILGFALIVSHGLAGFLLVLLTNAALLAAGLRGTKLEKRARALPVSDETLGQEYRRVAESWVKKALPDF